MHREHAHERKENSTRSILLVGVGGQGTILASKVLTAGLAEKGYEVKMSEIHGMAQRGGSVSTHVRFGERVASPVIEEGTADILVAFEKVEAARWISYLKPEGVLIVNDHEIYSLPVLIGLAAYPRDVNERLAKAFAKTWIVDASRIANRLGNARVQNIVLLGALVKAMEVEDIDWKAVLKGLVPEKAYALNEKAFEEGMKVGGGVSACE